MRKIFGLIILIGVWALIFLPLLADRAGEVFLPSDPQPRGRALPVPWQSVGRVRVFPGGEINKERIPPSGACGDGVTVRRGDTLGQIARACGVSLDDMLAANPLVRNANRIYPGQRLSAPAAVLVSGAPLPSNRSQAAFAPGGAVTFQADGFPPGARVRIGIGLSGSGFRRLASAEADSTGVLQVAVQIPPDARSGDEAFLLLTTTGQPFIQRISETFIISK